MTFGTQQSRAWGEGAGVWCKLVRDFLSNPNSAINNKNILTKSDVTLGGKPNIKFLKIDSDLKISISGAGWQINKKSMFDLIRT